MVDSILHERGHKQVASKAVNIYPKITRDNGLKQNSQQRQGKNCDGSNTDSNNRSDACNNYRSGTTGRERGR